MSCRDCEEAQEEAYESSTGIFFIRIGNGNVEVHCCQKHAMELIQIVRNHGVPEAS